MNQFAERYKKLSNAELVKIIDTPADYQPEAAEAAKSELATRNLTDLEMGEANAENERLINEKRTQDKKRRAVENKFRIAGNNLINTVHPIQQTPASVNKVILLMSIVFSAMGIVQLYQWVNMALALRHSRYSDTVLYLIINLFPALYLIVSAFLFWKRRKWGWVLLTANSCYCITIGLVFFLVIIWQKELHSTYGSDIWGSFTGSWLFSFLFNSACAWYLYKIDTREVYAIGKSSSIVTTCAGIVLGLLTFLVTFVH